MEVQEFLIVAIASIGLISLIKHIFTFLKWVWIMFLRPPKNLKKKYGSWALVTGSTDGIGKAIAFGLASNGLNIVLVGRNPSKLEATAKEIQENYAKHQIQVKSIVLDLSTTDGEEIERVIRNGIEGLDVGILINNAGLAYPYARFFHEVDLELMNGIIKVNAESGTWVTKAVISYMLKKKKGAIVSIGSGSSVIIPCYPLNAVYAATKKYLEMFSRCLNVEYKHQGIDVQCQIPLFVATKMSKMRNSNLIIASPKAYAKASMRWIGYEHLCTPIWSHSVQWLILKALPESLLDWSLFRFYLAMRKKGMEKEQRRANS